MPLPRANAGLFIVMLLGVWLQESSAKAWKYHEHMRIGRQSYRCACLWLSEATQLGSREQAAMGLTSTDREVCGVRPPRMPDGKEVTGVASAAPNSDYARAFVRDVVCASLEQTASSYGQATALAGDHLGEPADFRTIDGQRQTVGLLSYARRALSDGDHFHPRNTLMWHRYHEQALRHAQKVLASFVPAMGSWFDEQVRQRFIDAAYINAFADHFLQDAFAAGHMGFNRGVTRPTAAMPYHNLQNYRGRIVRDRLNHAFWLHGDAGLNWKFDGKPMLLYAASSSIYDVLLAMLTGARNPAIEQHTSDRLPVAYLDLDHLSLSELDAYGRAEGRVRRTDGQWVPVNVMHDPAHIRWAPGLEYRHAMALTEKDYERDQLTLLISNELAGVYGIRYDLGLGMGTNPLRGDGAVSAHQKVGLTVPIYAQYSSLLGYDLGLGAVADWCVSSCKSSDDEIHKDGLITGYLAFKINVEAGQLVLLQGFVEGLLGADLGGAAVGGIGFGVVLGKPLRTSDAKPYSGPPI